MSSGNPKHQLLAQFALVAKAAGHADRLELLEQLGQGERSVEMLAQKAGLSVASTSQHLQQLRRAGLVDCRRDRKYVLYRLADADVVKLLGALRDVAERGIAEVGRIVRAYFHDRDSMAPVSRQELLEQSRQGLVTVLDVRPADEFAAGHLPGALNIPLSELERRLSLLDPSIQVVAYCRSSYCLLSFEAVSILRARGFHARRLEEGLPEWKAACLPVERKAEDHAPA